jgi:hypothetical protein
LPAPSTIRGRPLATYRIYGTTLETGFPFRWPVPRGDGPVDLSFRCTDAPPLELDWATMTPAFSQHLTDREGSPDVSYHVLDELDVVRIRGVADHYLWPDRIVCHLHDPDLAYLVEIQLLGMVLALWLERRGVPTLHASVAVVDGSAVAFLGTKGGGKTTAATALVAAGHQLLVDDLVALRFRDGEVLAEPGYPMLRLWPEQLEHFLGPGHTDELPLVHPAFSKRRIGVGDRFGTFHGSAAPLRRVYVPQREDGGEVTLAPLRSSSALIELVQHSFLSHEMIPLGLARGRLAELARVVDRMPVSTVRYPNGFERLPGLVAAIEADVAEPRGG